MKLNLGKTPEQQAAEEAKKQRALEASIQQAMLERQQKIVALHKKQTQNKILIYGVSAIIIIALLVFGTYNTFFKKGLTQEDVQYQINSNISTLFYPSEGLPNYITENSQALFDKYMRIESDKYVSAEVDKNSVYISKVKKLSGNLSIVYFSADVLVTEKDTVVTDEELIKKLKRNGFGYKEAEETTEAPTTEAPATEAPVPEETPTEQPAEDGTTEQATEAPAEGSTEEVATTTEATTEAPTTEEDEPIISNTEMEMTSSVSEDTVEYYLLSNGTIMQRGAITTERYNFCLPVELYYNYDADGVTVVSTGYRPAGEMTLYTLNDVNQETFDEIKEHGVFAFNPETAIDEESKSAARIKVDKTLSDLYNKRDTSQDFLNFRTFNTYDADYVSLDKFELYTADNQMGYNSKVTYTIKTQQGFYYSVETYLKVEKSGNSWVITNIL